MLWRCRCKRGGLPVSKHLEADADGVAHLADVDRLQHAGVSQLRQDDRLFKQHRGLALVGLDAPHEPRAASTTQHRALAMHAVQW